MCKVTSLITPKKAVTSSKTSRKVRFGKVYAKLFHQPLSKTDKQSIWYSGSEYKAMNKEVHHSLRKELYYGFDPNDKERSWRGLEHIREGVPNVKLERRRHFVRSFLHVHKTMGVKDPYHLQALAASHSNEDQIRAQYFAEYDAYEAACVYNEQRWGFPCYDYDSSYDEQDQWEPLPLFDSEAERAEHYKEFSNIPRSTSPKHTKTIIMARTA